MKIKNKPRVKKIVARHKKMGTEYIFAEPIKHALDLCAVMTENSYPTTWLVNTKSIIFIRPKGNNK